MRMAVAFMKNVDLLATCWCYTVETTKLQLQFDIHAVLGVAWSNMEQHLPALTFPKHHRDRQQKFVVTFIL